MTNSQKAYAQTMAYAVVTVIAVTILHLLQMAIHFDYGWVASLAVLMVCLTMRKLCSVFLIDVLEYLCSINAWLNQKLELFLIQKDWDPNSAKPKKKSLVAFGAIQASIWMMWIVIGAISWLLCWGPAPVMAWKTEHTVHNIVMVAHRLSGGFLSKIFSVVWIILSLLVIVLWTTVVHHLYKNVVNKQKGIPVTYNVILTLIISIGATILTHIYGWFFFAYGIHRICQDIIFVIVAILVIALGFGVFALMNLLMSAK